MSAGRNDAVTSADVDSFMTRLHKVFHEVGSTFS